MPRNVLMTGIGGLSVALLVTGALGAYRVFSYLAALLILATFAVPAIEAGERERSVAPFTGLIAGLAVFFLVGLTGIWLLWDPAVVEYSYVLGVPEPTLVYFAFIWLLPLLGAIYYSLIFDRIGGEGIVDDILERARDAQRTEQFPLAPDQIERTTDLEVEDDD
ncbi:hypothetical protein [Halalkalicoccus tibetensis]|uniref:Uncharacterized protein n=1 Tax=Halalkalicoccus tibetensis TaxID=175632 RepID=A0ABD5V442_9EURY